MTRTLIVIGVLLSAGSAFAAWPPPWMQGFMVHPGGASPPASCTDVITSNIVILVSGTSITHC